MKFPSPLDAAARAAFGTMQALKGFFSRLGKANEERLKRISDQVKTLFTRTKESGRTHQSIERQLNDLQQESDEFYAVKNFVEKLPAGLTPPQYFDLATELLRKLGRGNEGMDINGLYTFKYRAVTKGKYYDVFPVIMFNSVHSVYFRGFNFHWERAPEYVESVYRTYSFFGVKSKFYKIKPHELEHFLRIPTFMPIYIPE